MKVDKYLLKAIKQLIKNPKYQVDNGILKWLDERQMPNLDKIKNIAKDIELNESKQVKKQEIEDAYSKATQEPILFNDNTFQADDKSQDVLSKVITSAPSDFETDWLDINNEPIHMTLDDLKGLAQAILNRGQELFKKKVVLKQQIDQVTNKDELDNIVWEDN